MRDLWVNWKFSQCCTSSPADSLPVHRTLLRQHNSTLGPEKTEFYVFEIFLPSELVWTYDKLNIYAKKNMCVTGILIDCPFRCNFCGESVNVCNCVNSSLVDVVLASETPEKECKVSKRKANTDNRLDTAISVTFWHSWSSDTGKAKYLRTLNISNASAKMLFSMTELSFIYPFTWIVISVIEAVNFSAKRD